MFVTLPESHRVRELSASAGGLSAAIHGLLAVLLVAATTSAGERPPSVRASERTHFAPLAFAPVRPGPPGERRGRATRKPPRSGRALVAAAARLPAIAPIDITLPDIPAVVPDIDLSENMPTPDDFRAAGAAAEIRNAMVDGPPGTGHGGPYAPDEVTRTVAAIPGTPDPRYPEMLRQARIEGEVITEFVIDTAGMAQLATVRIVRSAHVLFTRAVQDVLPRMRFFPAELNGYKVALRVRQPFSFLLRP